MGVSFQRAVPADEDETAPACNWLQIQPMRRKEVCDVGSATASLESPKTHRTRYTAVMVKEGFSPANRIVNRFDTRHIYKANAFTK